MTYDIRKASTANHSDLLGLAVGDDHTQYTVVNGRAGGQNLYGGTAANEDLTIQGTLHGTKTTSYVILQPSGGKVGIGTASPDSLLHTSVSTANTNTVQQLLTLSANSTGTAAAGFGSRILWELESSTTDDRTAAALDVQWRDATDETRSSWINLQTVHSGSLASILHNYFDATATGYNLFLGEESGNKTLSPAGGGAYLGSYNVGVGLLTLKSLTTGYANAVVGSNSGTAITTGYGNVAIGDQAFTSLTTGNSNVAIGCRAGYYETGSNKLFIDNATRTSEDDGRIKSLVYGEFHAAPVSQVFRTNAVTEILMTDAATNAATTIHKLRHNTTGTATTNFGIRSLWQLQSSTTADQDAAAVVVGWSDATHATRTSYMTFSTVNSAGSLTERMRITGVGNVGIGSSAASYALEVVRVAANSVVYVGTTTSGLAQIMAAGAYSDTNPGFFEASAGASFVLMNYDTTANNYSCISFKDANSYPVAQIAAVNTDHVNHGGYLAFWARPASGTALEVMRATPTEVVVNDTGASTVDFRVEGDTSANLLFVDASVDKIKVGGTAERATTAGTNAIDIFDGTAPVGTLANGISIYSKAGEFYALDAAGNETLNSPHDPETGEWIFWSRNTVTGRTYRVDMERMVAAIEALTGQSFSTETFESQPN